MADTARKGREGSRWYNERPDAKEVAKWFKDSVPIHDGLDHEDYISGITLITGKEKSNEVIGYRDNGTPVIEERQNLAFTPYPRVDIRIKYFHDLMEKHPDWYGVIEPIEVSNPRGVHLPPGFYAHRVRNGPNETVFVCCSMKVTVWEREGFEEKPIINMRSGESMGVTRTGKKIIDAPPATKMIASVRKYPDEHSLMKAETGAVGRALGMAGMLVVPGAGVATAEDVQEVETFAASPASPETPPEEAAPAEGKAATDEELREQAAALIAELKADHPEAFKEFQAWGKERNLGKLADTVSPALKGVVRMLERKLDEAKSGGS